MPINPILAIIKKEGSQSDTIFVFPSEIAARLWLEAALDILETESLPAYRFIAWDRFKEQAIRSTVSGKQPVSSRLRKLYAHSLVKRNTEKKTRLFTELIPEPYAENGAIFAPWIATILPSLALWERRMGTKAEIDTESRDLATLKKDYTTFLESHGLFEPSWQKPPLKDSGNRFIVFFPEAIEDYHEYDQLIASASFIETISVEHALSQRGEKEAFLSTYPTTREELSGTALAIEKLLQEGVCPETIAISVPDIETSFPYLSRELNLRGIPFDLRSGTMLTALPAARLFSLIQECVSSDFSFQAIKALLLDRLIPWKDRKTAESLVTFGIKAHCVTSWKEEDEKIDVWEAAFNEPDLGASSSLKTWYRVLRDHLFSMTTSKSFTEIRKTYFSFKNRFLIMENLSQEENDVLGRCLVELSNLSALEQLYPEILPDMPWAFFVSVLNDTRYVPQRAQGGVSIFPYRVAAGTPFVHHFILDASQSHSTVVYQELPFLRQDRRLRLGLSDTDASSAFFGIYRLSGAHWSFAEHTFAGYSTPHGYFSTIPATKPELSDPFHAEARFFINPAELPDRRYPIQKDGLANWKSRLNPGRFSFINAPFSDKSDELVNRIKSRQMDGDLVRVSQKDLDDFSICNARWFLSKILKLKRQERDAALFNERNLGLLVHSALREVYSRILKTDKAFLSSNIETYYTWAEDCAKNAAAEHTEFQGPLAAPLIALFSSRVADNIKTILNLDAETLDNAIPKFLEEKLSFKDDGMCYYGEIDRISLTQEDSSLILIDYKTGKVAGAADYLPIILDEQTDEQALKNYQIPMYIFLVENALKDLPEGQFVREAWFADISNKKYSPIVTDKKHKGFKNLRNRLTRTEFDPAMKAFRETANRFSTAVLALNFTKPQHLLRKECTKCDFFRICRTRYLVEDS